MDGAGPQYASGGMYLLSWDVLGLAVGAAEARPDKGLIIPFEDVNMALLLLAAGNVSLTRCGAVRCGTGAGGLKC